MTSNNDDGNDSQDPYSLDLAEFIDERSDLYVVMGVFAALAIYIHQSAEQLGSTSVSGVMVQAGFFAAFSLAILTFGLAYSKMRRKFDSWIEFFHAHFKRGNEALLMFSVLSAVLISSMAHVMIFDDSILFLIIITGAAALAVGAGLWSLHALDDIVPNAAKWRIPTMLMLAFVVLVVATVARTQILAAHEIQTIHELTFSNLVPLAITVSVVVAGTVQSISAIAILGSLFAIPVAAYDKYR